VKRTCTGRGDLMPSFHRTSSGGVAGPPSRMLEKARGFTLHLCLSRSSRQGDRLPLDRLGRGIVSLWGLDRVWSAHGMVASCCLPAGAFGLGGVLPTARPRAGGGASRRF